MRAVVLLLSVLLAAGVFYWLEPDLVPPEIRGAVQKAETAIAHLVVKPAPAVAADQPVWPDALDRKAHRTLPLGWLLFAAGLASGIVVAGIWLVRRKWNFGGGGYDMPEWLSAARRLADATQDRRLRHNQCDIIERKLVPDVKRRGAAALARAHQLDLYCRFVSRSNMGVKSFVKVGPQIDRWRSVAKQTLESIALGPASRTTTMFRQMQPTMWALDAGDARELRRYYDRLSGLITDHDQAWAKANAALAKPVLDQAALVDAMESLRQINRTIAKESAAIVGDIEIAVRAAS